MRILLLGANGFIGGHVLAALRGAGHQVVAGVRDPAALMRRVPGLHAIQADFNADTEAATWAPRLAGIDAVVNCAGVLQGGRGQDIAAIHHHAPAALFAACEAAGVRRVIHVSAISADAAADTDYARTKLTGEAALRATALDWVILRPSLVYAAGSYGGTSLMRGMAALPWVIPLPGDGQQAFSPIHADDLAGAILQLLETQGVTHATLIPVGPETLTLADILVRWRAWLGLAPARLLRLPMPLVRLACRAGDVLGAGPLSTTSLRQIEHGNAAPVARFAAAIGATPRAMQEALATAPAQTQDLWHARLYLLRPVMTLALVLLWLGSGIAGLLLPWAESARLSALPPGIAGPLGMVMSVVDLIIAGALLLGRRPMLVGALQLIMVAGYTAFLTLARPALWFDPFGALLKNLPILALVLAWMAIARDR
jgi:uncharacterized protein YbjT (DUF2867 family)